MACDVGGLGEVYGCKVCGGVWDELCGLCGGAGLGE